MNKILKVVFFLIWFLSGLMMKAQNYISLTTKVEKILYDGKRNKLYAIVNSLDTKHGNNLIVINPKNGDVEKELFVGSDPNCMVLTRDTNYLYIGLDGASFIKRVNLSTFLIDQTINLGNGSVGALFAGDLATVNISSDLIIVARNRSLGWTPRNEGVVAYFKGNKLPSQISYLYSCNKIIADYDSNLVFGVNNESTSYDFTRMVVDTVNGLTLIDVNKNIPMGSNVKIENHLLYSDKGKVLDPYLLTPSYLGTFSNVPYDQNVEADYINNKVFFGETYGSDGLRVKRYNLTTQVYIDDLIILKIFPYTFQAEGMSDLIRFSKNGLAILIKEYSSLKERKLILVESCFVSDESDIEIKEVLNDVNIFKKDTVSVKIIVANKGKSDAYYITIIDSVSSSMDIINPIVNKGVVNISNNVLQWSIDTIQANKTDTGYFKIVLKQDGVFTNRLCVKTNSLECDYSNNNYVDSVSIKFDASSNGMDYNSFNLILYPQPVKDFIYVYIILLKPSKNIDFSIYDSFGQIVYNYTYEGVTGMNEFKLELTELPNAFYVMEINTGTTIKRKGFLKLE